MQRHPKAQSIECVACHEKFTRAFMLVQHIENNDCPCVNAEDFARQKAEKQVVKDAWASQLDPLGGFYGPSERPSTTGHVDLDNMTVLDDNSPSHHEAALDLHPTSTGACQARKPFFGAPSRLALNNFPVLPKREPLEPSPNDSNLPSHDQDLMDLSQAENRTLPDANQRWVGNENVARMLFPQTTSPHPSTTPSELGDSERLSSFTTADQQQSSEVRPSMWSVLTEQSTYRPPLSDDPNASNVRVQSATRLIPRSILDPEQYYNEITERYECPSIRCRGKYATNEEFKAHLLSEPHSGGKTQCPSCLNRFKTTWALIAHCESGSRKCQIRKTNNYDQILRELTAGLLGTDGFLSDGSVKYTARHVQEWV